MKAADGGKVFWEGQGLREVDGRQTAAESGTAPVIPRATLEGQCLQQHREQTDLYHHPQHPVILKNPQNDLSLLATRWERQLILPTLSSRRSNF